MLKYVLAAAPYVFKAPRKEPARSVAGAVLSVILFAAASVFLLFALFMVVNINLGPEMACLTVGAILLIAGLLVWTLTKPKVVKAAETDAAVSTAIANEDPVASILPDTIKDNPGVQRIMSQMAANPVAASLAALSVGLLISHEIFKDK